MEKLTKETFQQKVYDYESGEDFEFKGELPCIVDFYADWCEPCTLLAPVMEDISKFYAGRMNVYKVNIDEERDLAKHLGIQSIPRLLFAPKKGKPGMIDGSVKLPDIQRQIKELLKVEG